MKELEILRFRGGKPERARDALAEEFALRLYAGPIRLGILLCSPRDLEDLVWGFLLTSGLVREAREVREVRVDAASGAGVAPGAGEAAGAARIELAGAVDPLRLDPVIGSACGSLPLGTRLEEVGAGNGEEAAEGGPPSPAAGPEVHLRPPYPIPAGRVLELMRAFVRGSPEFAATGAVHSAAIAAPAAGGAGEGGPGLLALREDIGRHNAVDKAVGAFFRQGIPLEGRILLTSGRISSEAVLKAARCGLAAVVSRGAPTDRAVALARRLGITLVGFARGNRLNLYSGEGRIRPS